MRKIPENRKKELEQKLTKIADRVAKKPVYIINKTDFGYSIVHYISNCVLIADLPELSMAKRLVEKANSKNSLQATEVNKIRKRLNEYYKHFTDIQYYLHAIENSADAFKVDAVRTRLALSRAFLKEAKSSLRF